MFIIKNKYQKILSLICKLVLFLFFLPVVQLLFEIVLKTGILLGTKLRVLFDGICI